MTIAFVDPISEIFYRKIILCNNLNDVFATQSICGCLQSRKL